MVATRNSYQNEIMVSHPEYGEISGEADAKRHDGVPSLLVRHIVLQLFIKRIRPNLLIQKGIHLFLG
jgi:hypothetical protein